MQADSDAILPMGDLPQLPGDGSERSFKLVVIYSFIAGLLVAPWLFEQGDMWGCWIPWARITGGLRPWMAYSRPDCNYPPFMLYVWTVVEAIERLAHARYGLRLRLIVTLIKLPNLLACSAGAMLCMIGLRKISGGRVARAAGIAYALCLPLWFDAVVWGQCDAILCLAMLACLLAMLNNRPVLAGACVGWGLSIKLQAIVLLPTTMVYTLIRLGWRALLQAALAAVAMLALVLAPMIIAGTAHQVQSSYTGAVGQYPFLSINTFNPWSLVTLVNVYLRHMPRLTASLDSPCWFWHVTPKRIGFLAFSSFTAFLMIGLYLRPTRYNAVLSAGLTAYGFYMLSTEMHERYVIPAAAILSICAVSGGRRIYLAVMIPALLSQLKGFIAEYYTIHKSTTPGVLRIFDIVTLFVSSINLCLFLWICVAYFRQVYNTRMPLFDHLNADEEGFARV